MYSQYNSYLSAVRRHIAHGVYNIHTNSYHYPASTQPTHARIEQIVDYENPEESDQPASTKFPPIKPAISRNFMVTDTYIETPPAGIAPLAYEVPFRTSPQDRIASQQADLLAPFKGLGAVSEEIRDLLPAECRAAFDKAAKREGEWFAKWGNEADSTCRREPVVDKAVVPYSMTLAS